MTPRWTAPGVGLFGLLILVVAGLLLTLPVLPGAAQDATFATNTPAPPPPETLAPPDAPLERYALRLWLEQGLVDRLIDQVRLLEANDAGRLRAVQLLQHELERRYPGAPHQSQQREDLIAAMLAAPRGTVDMRRLVRPFVQTELNRQPLGGSFTRDGFRVEVLPANVDGVDPTDALIHIRFPASATDRAAILYDDYVLAQITPGGQYVILEATPTYPVAPFGAIGALTLEQVADVNDDGLDEMVLVAQSAGVNDELLIYGWRNQAAVNMIAPGQKLTFGQLRESTRPATIAVTRYRIESDLWGCLSELEEEWAYSGNLFRPVGELNRNYHPQDSLACRLYEAEPLFDQAPGEAITTVQTALAAFPPNEPGSNRAAMVLAMLYALDGQPGRALEVAQGLAEVAGSGSWLESQTNTFIAAISLPSTTSLSLCAALTAADDFPACDIDSVLARLFRERPVMRDEPMIDQLEARGIPVLESVMVSEIGLADRLVLNLDLAGASWWAFAPVDPEYYIAERSDPPGRFEAAVFPLAAVDVPQAGYDALLLENDLRGALTVLDTVIQDNPGLPLSPAARYFDALLHDLSGDRQGARERYFGLWRELPTNLWGQLAGHHLERR